MRQKLITLCPTTWDLAQKVSTEFKTAGGFSWWVREQLRSWRNKYENDDILKANTSRKVEELTSISTARLLFHLEQLSESEIAAIISLLKNGLK